MGLECLVKLSLKDKENQILKLSRKGKERKNILLGRGKSLQTRIPAMHIEETCLTVVV